jgi:general secretion pathway protein D
MKMSRRWILRVILGAAISSLGTAAPQKAEPTAAGGNGANGLCLNFHNAPLNLVLEYLSDAAGFIINTQAEVRGDLYVWSKAPVTPEEAVELVNAALRTNGCALVRNGRILTLVSLADAKRQGLEVVVGNNPEAVEKSEEVITQIIPVRYIGAAQLMNNLQPLLPAGASLSVNESANALILLAPKADIRRTLKIVAALDSSRATASLLKVFPLHYADAKQLAAVVQQLFSTQTSSQISGGMDSRSQGFLPGDGFGPPGSPPGLAGTGLTDDAGAGSAALGRVVATADESSNSLIVSAPAPSMTAISNLAAQIDQPVTDITELRIFPLANADANQLADQLSQLFPDTTANSAQQNQMGFYFDDPPGADLRGDSNGASDRANKKSRVLAVAEPRTSSLLVGAPSTCMPQIARLIENLDTSPARKEKIQVYELMNADPQDVSQVLQDLFNRNTAMRNNGNNRNSLLGQANPLTTRQTQQQNSTSSTGQGLGKSSAMGTGGGSGGGGGGGEPGGGGGGGL